MPAPKYSTVPTTAYHSTLDISSTNPTNPIKTGKASKKAMKTKTRADHRYKALRNLGPKDEEVAMEEGEGLDSQSSTEVEDIEEDARMEKRAARRWRKEGTRQDKRKGVKRVWELVKGYRWVLDTGLLLLVVALLLDRRQRGREWGGGGKRDQNVGGDVTGFAPSFTQQVISFTPNDTFSPEQPLDWWSDETQQAWLDIVPEGLGYVLVQDPSQHTNLPNPIHDYPNQTVYTTSMTHQLHCLYTVIEAYNTLQLVSTTTPLSTSSSSYTHHTSNEIKMPWHVTHCFEYLRQSIMCSADVALEGAATTFPKGKGGVDLGGSDGWDAKHVCRDYGEVKAYLEKEAVWRQKWIKSEDVEIEEG